MSMATHAAHAHYPPGTQELLPVKLDPAAVTFAPGSGKLLAYILFVLGALGVLATLMGAFGVADKGVKHAVAAWHVGFIFALGLALGSLGLVMIFHQFNAGWSTAIRRQLENVASLFPVLAILGAPVLLVEVMNSGVIFGWMNPALTDPHAVAFDPVAEHKSPFLNQTFFVIRAGIYFIIWTALGYSLWKYSIRQDTTGERSLTARARWNSSFGLVLFALTTAFAAFDWMMSLDYHWFSTMWGVYFFAGNNVAATALLIITLTILRSRGKLQGMATREHFHDLGKMLLAFTVFWAYIAFSQYFLIWYANIPEETGWYYLRRQYGWGNVGFLLAIGHFAAPFLILLWRGSKRNMFFLSAIAGWMLLIHAVDVFYMIRPILSKSAYPGAMGLEHWWIDVGGLVGPVALFLGAVVLRAVSHPLVPLKDPRLAEAVEHKNYI